MTSIGFTGTQRGMTQAQKTRLQRAADYYAVHGYTTFHHGDCIGADAEAHEVFTAAGFVVVLHPPISTHKRAFCEANFVEPPFEYMTRNHHIVDCANVMLATPGEPDEQLRSGTWATIRYARKCGKELWVITPDGTTR